MRACLSPSIYTHPRDLTHRLLHPLAYADGSTCPHPSPVPDFRPAQRASRSPVGHTEVSGGLSSNSAKAGLQIILSPPPQIFCPQVHHHPPNCLAQILNPFNPPFLVSPHLILSQEPSDQLQIRFSVWSLLSTPVGISHVLRPPLPARTCAVTSALVSPALPFPTAPAPHHPSQGIQRDLVKNHITKRMHLENIMLSEMSQSQNDR